MKLYTNVSFIFAIWAVVILTINFFNAFRVIFSDFYKWLLGSLREILRLIAQDDFSGLKNHFSLSLCCITCQVLGFNTNGIFILIDW